ncbi:MAG TPA: ATP-binding protein [Acidobacteriota bacterium]|nr:ATP-binding protein [Acidobacteriota bacterium]
MPKLVIKKPSGKEEDMVLNEPEYSLGRSSDNSIVLEDSDVSRYHCVIRRQDDGYLIEDLQSHNGTYLNSRKIDKSVLNHGDKVQIGHHVLSYSVMESSLPAISSVLTHSIEGDYDELISQLTSPLQHAAEVPEGGDRMAQLEREHRTLRLLLDLGSAFSTDQSVEEVCRKATRILLASTEAERAAIFLLEEDKKTLHPVTSCERDGGADSPEPVVLSRTIAEKILSERRGIVTSDAVADERFAHGKSVVASGLHSVACSPLLGKSGNLGILYMENKATVGAFAHEDLQLLCAVASQIGLAIENARFSDALRRTNENLELLVEERTSALAKVQLKLYQTEKIASLSRLVAGVAHEINNPLGALKSNLDMLTASFNRLAASSNKSAEDARVFEDLSELGHVSADACARIVSVVRSLSSFARLDEAAFKYADINEAFKTVVHLLDPALTRRIRIELTLGEIPPIPCFPALLNEAFMNLLVNACQAIKESGRIFVETRREADSAVITVRDTGCGIPREHLDTIFDPGFTTKGVGVGVGLGLAVVHNVISAHQGSISVESTVGQGSIFTLSLPLSRTSPAA